VAGKLTRTSGSSATVYDINAQGMVTKEDWGGGEYAAYEYDADGYLVKIIEHWGGADHLKMQAVITNGNIMKHTTYDDDGVTVKKIKEFTYTTGENVNNIHQASMIDNNTKPCGNLFGKPSKKLVDFLEYWDPRTTDPKGKTTITYEFDSKNRPSKITRSGAGWQEVYTYSYYE
jgi:YD repeat-containing protein